MPFRNSSFPCCAHKMFSIFVIKTSFIVAFAALIVAVPVPADTTIGPRMDSAPLELSLQALFA